ncbi:MAG: glycosyltransferase family 4 protein [Blastocatellia bacterium]
MRIAVWHNLPSGGGKRALYYQIKGLVERGHSVECWSPDMADLSYLPLKEFAPEHVVPFDYKPRTLPGHAGKAVSRYLNAINRLRAMDKACKQSAKEIEAGGFDILFASSCLLYNMPQVMRYARGPKVVYLQEPCRLLYEARPVLPWVGRVEGKNVSLLTRTGRFVFDQLQGQSFRIQARREWSAAHSCDRILVNSYYSRESLLRAYGRSAKVCYLGVDTSLFRNLRKPREGFIVGLGAFCPPKRIDLAIKAIAHLKEPRPKLVWIGNGGVMGYLEEMKSLALSLGVEFEAKNTIPDSELVDILNRAALMLYTPQLEPFGLAPLEANACGTPVVAVAEGGVRETIKDEVNGMLVAPEPDSLAEAVAKLLRDPALARLMGERASDHVQQKWIWSASIDNLEENLLQVAQSSAAQRGAACSAH